MAFFNKGPSNQTCRKPFVKEGPLVQSIVQYVHKSVTKREMEIDPQKTEVIRERESSKDINM